MIWTIILIIFIVVLLLIIIRNNTKNFTNIENTNSIKTLEKTKSELEKINNKIKENLVKEEDKSEEDESEENEEDDEEDDEEEDKFKVRCPKCQSIFNLERINGKVPRRLDINCPLCEEEITINEDDEIQKMEEDEEEDEFSIRCPKCQSIFNLERINGKVPRRLDIDCPLCEEEITVKKC